MPQKSFDPVWNDIYDGSNMPRAPYDYIASFVFRNAPKNKARNQINILEIGCGAESTDKAINEVHRVLKTNGAFFYNPIADSDTSYRSGKNIADHLTVDIQEGDYKGVGQINFVSRRDINNFVPETMWNKKRIERVEVTDMLNSYGKIVASWRVEAIKVTS